MENTESVIYLQLFLLYVMSQETQRTLYNENYFSINLCDLAVKGGIHLLLLFKVLRVNKPDKLTWPKHRIWALQQNKFCRMYLSTFPFVRVLCSCLPPL